MANVQGNSVPLANLKFLDKLIAASHEFAQIMGYNSYAEFVVQHCMASSLDVVTSFLHELSEAVRLKANQEFKAIRNVKRGKCG